MSDFVEFLVEMGFDENKAKKAVHETGNLSVEAAMEWILAHSDEDTRGDDPDEANEVTPEEVKTNEPPQDTTIRSYKCDECGKQFKNSTELEFHAAKTQHQKFSESTEEKQPLTAEEKAAQLKRIEEKLKEKKAEREAREKEEVLEKEKFRIKSGKEIGEAKRRIEEQQMKEIAEARRREKIEDRTARERVRAQIEADKVARRAKQADSQGQEPLAATTTPLSVNSPSTTQPNETIQKDYKETKLQVRLPNGKALVQSFGVQETLAAVRLYVELNRDDGTSGPFNLMSTFPRKVYEGDDYNIPLAALGLVPSAVLMVTRC